MKVEKTIKDGEEKFFLKATPTEAWAQATYAEVARHGAKVVPASAADKAAAAKDDKVEDRPTKASALDRLQSKAKSSIAKAEKEAEMAAATKKDTAAARKAKAAERAASKAEVKKVKAEAKAARAKAAANGEKDYSQRGVWSRGAGARTKLEAGEKPYSGKRQTVYEQLLKGVTVEKLSEKIGQQLNAVRSAMWDVKLQIKGEGAEWDPVGYAQKPKVYRLAD